MRALVLLAAAGLLLCGCSNPAQQEAAAVALEFSRAEPARACELLAPVTAQAVADRSGSCEQALGSLSRATGDVVAAEVAGESAQVRLDGDVLFLAHFPGGWLVRAAGCAREDPDPAVPYTCEVEP